MIFVSRTFVFRTIGRLLPIILLALLAACGSKKESPEESGKPIPLEKISKKVKLVKQWDRNIGNGQGKGYNRLTLGVSEKGVCAADSKGRVRCYDHEGKKLWSQHLKERLSGGVGVSESLALVATANGIVIALDIENGFELWRYDIRGLVLAAPQADDGIVVVQSSDGRLLALDAVEGAKRWEYKSDEPLLTLRGTATPVIDSGVVYTGFASGKVVALQLSSGLLLWDGAVAVASGTAEIERLVDVDASPRVTTDAVYAASVNGYLNAYSRRNGRPKWRFETSTFREVSSGLSKVYLVDEESRVFAIDAVDGEQRWEQSALLNRNMSAPIVFAGYMLVADYKGFVHVLSQVDGSIIGRRRVDRSGVRVPMRTFGRQLYIYSNDGELSSYTLKSR